MIMNIDDVVCKTELAIEMLLRDDFYLLSNNLNERSITHKLAEHIQVQFPEWHVDCEYNKNHDQVKSIHLEAQTTDNTDTDATTVYPDIIIHRRGFDQNLLVVEVKKSTNPNNGNFDKKKIEGYIRDIQYQCALFLKFGTGSNIGTPIIEKIWYRNNKGKAQQFTPPDRGILPPSR